MKNKLKKEIRKMCKESEEQKKLIEDEENSNNSKSV